MYGKVVAPLPLGGDPGGLPAQILTLAAYQSEFRCILSNYKGDLQDSTSIFICPVFVVAAPCPRVVVKILRKLKLRPGRFPLMALKDHHNFYFTHVQKGYSSLRSVMTEIFRFLGAIRIFALPSRLGAHCHKWLHKCNLKSYDSRPNVSTLLSTVLIRGDLRLLQNSFYT